MSNVRINLLPGEVEERNRQRRRMALAGFVVLGIVVLLAGGYVWQLNRVSDARAELESEQEVLAELEAEVAELQPFDDLAAEQEQVFMLLSRAMAPESSFAGILQNVSAVMPADAQVDSLSISLSEEPAPGLGDERPVLGTLSLTGQTLDGHAPGVERMLLEFDKVGGFFDVFVTSSSLDPESDVTTFNVEVDLGPEIRTRRYEAGLPPGLRPGAGQ